MGLPSRQQLEFRIGLNVAGGGRRSTLPEGTSYRIEKEVRRRAEMLGLRVYGVKIESSRILVDVLFQPTMVKENIERGLNGAIRAILQRDVPHLVKRTGRQGRDPLGGVIF